MADEGSDAEAQRHVRPVTLGALCLSGAGPLLLACAALTGLGLARGAGAGAATLTGLALVGLPLAGLIALSGRRPLPGLAAAWIWSLAVLTSLPLYFPGERGPATEQGLRLFAAPLGESAALDLGALGERLTALLGDSGEARSVAVPIERGEPHHESGTAASAIPVPEAASTAPHEASSPTFLPYRGDESSLRVAVEIDGPDIGEGFDMIFDTGATFTTLSHEAIERLDIHIPADAPRATLVTANGEIESPLALVDAIWLGDEVVEWVTVAVCDSCANPPSVGLLGLNVSSQFRVSLDHDEKRIELLPRGRTASRRSDVARWLEFRSRATAWWDGRVEIELHARNLARQEIESAVVELRCGDDYFAVQIEDIASHGERQTTFDLPSGTDCSTQSIELSRARWLLDRF